MVLKIILFILGLIVLFFVLCKLSTKVEVATRMKAPTKLRCATEKEKQYFIHHYIQVGRKVNSDKYRRELEELSDSLMVFVGELTYIRKSLDYGYSRTVPTIAVQYDNKVYSGLDLSCSSDELSDDLVGEPVLVYCLPNKKGDYRIVTSSPTRLIN